MEEKLFQVHWYLPTTTSSMRQSSVMRQDTKEYKSLREILTTAKARSQRAVVNISLFPTTKLLSVLNVYENYDEYLFVVMFGKER